MAQSNFRTAALLLTATAFLAACGGEPDTAAPSAETPDADLVADGRDVVEAQCARCHATGVDGDSPRADAPPLRTVLAGYDAGALAQDFREGIHVGHPDMPDFNFGPRGVDAVLAYLVSIQEATAAE